MRFSEYIIETFNSKAKIKIVNNDNSQVIIEFEVDSIEYSFVADHLDYNGQWEIVFVRLADDSETLTFKMSNNTNSTNVLKVFNALFVCIEYLVQHHSPTFITFTASKSEPSRISFYKKLLNNNKVKQICKYKSLDIDDEGADIRFIITR